MTSMFGTKKHADLKKLITKLKDSSKGIFGRIKSLRNALCEAAEAEASEFLRENYYLVFYLISDAFEHLENISTKTHKKGDEVDVTIEMLERLIMENPDPISIGWQQNGMGRLIKRLLHPNNLKEKREIGIKLFLEWYCIMRDSSSNFCDQTFQDLIPSDFNNHSLNLQHDFIFTPGEFALKISPAPFNPIVVKSPNEYCESRELMRKMLDLIILSPDSIRWPEASHKLKALNFLMNRLKKVYVGKLFKNSPLCSIYNTNPPPHPDKSTMVNDPIDGVREELLLWLAKYVCRSQDMAISNVNEDLIHQVIFSSRHSVDVVLDLFRYALLLPASCYSIKKQILYVYTSWFLTHPNGSQAMPPIFFNRSEVEKTQKMFESLPLEPNVNNKDERDSYVPFQRALTWYIIHIAGILQPYKCYSDLEQERHLELCSLVINNYKRLSQEVRLERETWHELLLVLLRSTDILMVKRDAFTNNLAKQLFSTLLTIWLKAAQTVEIEKGLWNSLLSSLKSLTRWKELIDEWSSRLFDLTKDLAVKVYGVELPDGDKTKHSDRIASRQNNSLISRVNTEIEGRSGLPPQEFSPQKVKAQKLLQKEKRQISGEATPGSKLSLDDEEPQLSKWRSDSDLTAADDNCETLPRVASHTSVYEAANASPAKEIRAIKSQDTEYSTSIIGGEGLEGAVVLWRRFVGILGNVNEIEEPYSYGEIVRQIERIIGKLEYVRDNMKFDCDVYPPIAWFSSWLFAALRLDDSYQKGKLTAIKLLCKLLLDDPKARHSLSFISRFIHTIHTVLHSGNDELRNIIVKECSSKILSADVAGVSLLFSHLAHASYSVLESKDLNQPRKEAVSLLFGLLNVHDDSLPSLDPRCLSPALVECKNLKEDIIQKLIYYSKTEQSEDARIVALNSISSFTYKELSICSQDRFPHPVVKDNIHVLLATVHSEKLKQKSISRVACDLLVMLAEKVDKILTFVADIPGRVIESLVHTLCTLLSKPDEKLTVGVMLTCLEWVMRCPLPLLLDNGAGAYKCFLQKVFSALEQASSGDIQPRPDEPSIVYETIEDVYSSTKFNDDNQFSIKLAADAVINSLINLLGVWPMGGGAALLHSHVNEAHDNVSDLSGEFTSSILNASNLQWLVSNGGSVISAIQLPQHLSNGGGTGGLVRAENQARFLIRNFIGKYCWDATFVYGMGNCRSGSYTYSNEDVKPLSNKALTYLTKSDAFANKFNELDSFLLYIEESSPECRLKPGQPLDSPYPLPSYFGSEAIANATKSLTSQQAAENERTWTNRNNPSVVAKRADAQEVGPRTKFEVEWPFCITRLFLWHLGLGPIEKRQSLDILEQGDPLIRHLKNIDKQLCRETHKVGLLYAASGQKTKAEMLDNDAGSRLFEDTVSGLGWDVELSSHPGFTGGLSRNKCTTTYYASSWQELVWHVSTRMESGSDEKRHLKLKHLGNDEVLVVFVEKGANFSRSTLRTDFADVLIIIKPAPSTRLSTKAVSVTIDTKKSNMHVGPLYNGAIVEIRCLPQLLRATVLNASRKLRFLLPHFKQFYEERSHYVKMLVEEKRRRCTFEDFAEALFAPVLPSISVPYLHKRNSPAVENSDHNAESELCIDHF
ncbi:DgyrCDS11513 [Dimorphilus gyrociliatus]|uniref:DgyrCDS11513 n=1 Tax=Dimorphilus gyrociliatus TaxID=2664684 RepID=A0A7I8W3R1_9ANNE|nr:DgyrCDS11513 [Dimorphilus gyrociliatus]